MKLVDFGNTGIKVSQLALGGHEFLEDGRSRGFNENNALAITPGHLLQGFGGIARQRLLHRAFDHGINLFDVTIDSEKEALGRNLHQSPPPYEVYIQSRPEGFCYSYDEGNLKFLDYGLLKAEVIRCIKLLRRERIDFLNVGLLAWSIDRTPDYLERLSVNLARLKAEGLIAFAIADSFSGQRLYLRQIDSGAFDGINVDLSIGKPNATVEVMPAARRSGMGIICREVFFKGEIFRIGQELGIEDKAAMANVALSWAAQQNPDVMIVGATDSAQLDASVQSLQANTEIDNELVQRIRASAGFAAYERKRTAEFFERA